MPRSRMTISKLMILVAISAVITVLLLWIHRTADRWEADPMFQFVYVIFVIFFFAAPSLARSLQRWQSGINAGPSHEDPADTLDVEGSSRTPPVLGKHGG